MSQRKRASKGRSGRKGTGNKGNGNKGNGNNAASNGKSSRNNRRRKSNKNSKKFWGDPEKLPEPLSGLEIAEDPSTIVASLGRPPIPGQENVASHYFRAVYGSAAQLAGALSAAGDLLAKPEEDPLEPEHD